MKKIKWTPLFLTQFFGVLNDNLLKGAISFMSIMWVAKENKTLVLALASALLVIPYLLLSPLAARLSMNHDKKIVVNISKMAEIPIMLIAITGFTMQSLPLAFIALFLMGLQSAIYSPSKYGLIKDIGGNERLNYGSGLMELLTFTGVLLGMVVAGLIASMEHYGTLTLSIAFISLALAGWWMSNKIEANEPETCDEQFQAINPLKFFKSTWKEASKIKGLKWTILGLGSFWFLGSLLQMNLLIHLPETYELSSSSTSFVIAAVAIGIGLGCYVSAKIVKHRIELGMVPLGGFAMAICLTLMGTMELSLTGFVFLAFSAAFFSGVFKIPLNAWLQERTEGRKLGKILALLNMVVYLFVLLSALAFEAVSGILISKQVFLVIAAAAWIMSIVTLVNIPALLLRFVFLIASRLIFRIKISGQENLPKKSGALIVANHTSYLDFILMVAAVPRQIRMVMLKDLYENKLVHWLLKKLNMIPINARGGMNDLEEFNRLCQEQINQGHVVCIFAEGTVTRTGQMLEFKKGMEHIAKGIDAPIIPLHFDNVIGSPLSFTVGNKKMVLPKFNNWFKRINISIGTPKPSNSSSFEIMQDVKELEAEAFSNRINDKETLGTKMFESLKKTSSWIGAGIEKIKSRDLLKNALTMSSALNDELKEHQTVNVMLPKGIMSMTTNLCLQFLNKTVVNLSPELLPEERFFIRKKFSADVIITTKDMRFTRFSHCEPKAIFIEDLIAKIGFKNRISGFMSTFLSKQVSIPEGINKNSVATIIVEKDPQGELKSIPLSHENILAELESLSQIFHFNNESKILSDFELSNAYGFVLEFCLPLCKGLALELADESNMKAFIDKFNTYRPTILLSSIEEIHSLIVTEQDLSCLQHIYTGPENLSSEQLQILKENDVAVFSSLGLNECCSVFAVNVPDFDGLDVAGKPMRQKAGLAGTTGRPIPGIAIKIVNPENIKESLGAMVSGQIWVKGASVIKEYVDNCYDWSQSFYEGWLKTPFTGYLDNRGFLVLS